MLTNSEVLFLNCVGSYFYCLIYHKSSQKMKNSLLYYLAQGNLCFTELCQQEIQEKYGDNAWGYQPISIINENNKKVEINNDFLRYIYSEYNIDVECKDVKLDFDLTKYLFDYQETNKYVVCCVDEFYLPNSIKYFGKKHNKHFLLVKEYDPNKEQIEVIDSEQNKPYKIHSKDITQAIFMSNYARKFIYLIDCSHFRDFILKENVVTDCLKNKYNIGNQVISCLKKDLSSKMESGKLTNYFYKGYYFTILSKIYPYMRMISQVLIDTNEHLYSNAMEIANDWKSLSNFMLYKIQKNNYSETSVIKKIDSILVKQEKMNMSLEGCKGDIHGFKVRDDI